jgi:putative hydrolase of the HAD superfamily
MNHSIKVIGFDADDTLWINEPYFKETEEKFCNLLNEFQTKEHISQKLFDTETKNISIYGYGIKSFTLSMIETALEISNKKVDPSTIEKIITLGKELIKKPVELIDNVESVLKHLKQYNYKLIVVTKGDLLDQQRKLNKSGLENYFHQIEIVSDKQEKDYNRLLSNQDIQAKEFLMIGNSMKSDILPVLNLGGYAIHVPYSVTWGHEVVEDKKINHDRYVKIDTISQAIDILNNHETKD